MINNSSHEFYMSRCIEIAKKGLGTTFPNPCVGCIIVHKNKIVSSGYNKSSIFNNKTFRSIHAEIDAINKLIKINKFQNKGNRNNCSLYVVRIQNGSNKFKMSKPCQNCIENIKIQSKSVFQDQILL